MDDATRAMLSPRRIAIVGASSRPGSFGERLVHEVDSSTADLEVFLVHPTASEIGGRPVVASLDEIDGPVDLVLLGVSDRIVEDELRRAARRGDRSAVIYSSLFEPDDPTSTALRDRITSIATEAEMALCGAGCMGFVNPVAGVRAVGYVERADLPVGPVAMITHSGSVFSAMLRTRRQLGFSLVVSAGQELVTGAASYLEYALEQEETRVVCLFLETMRNPDHLRRALLQASAQDVAVVALTVGASEAGRSMVAAHSGALAGGDGAWEALFEATGVCRVGDLDQLLDTVELFASPRRARPRRPGSGMASVHDSGGERTLVVDVASDLGVPFAQIAPSTTDRLAGLLDTGLRAENPLDVWGTGSDTETLFTETLLTMAEDDAVDFAVLALDFVAEYDGDTSYLDAARAVQERTTTPVAVLANVGSALDEPTAIELRRAGIPVLEGTRSGLVAIRHFLEFPDRPRTSRPTLGIDDARQARWRDRLTKGPLHGPEGFALLAEYGIPVLSVRAAASGDEACAVAHEIGFPVVMKTDVAGVEHKSDVGGVVLDLATPEQVLTAYDDLARRLGPEVIVSAQATAGVELSLGIVRDPHLGPLVVIASGGVFLEILGDRVVRLPPVDATAARAALLALRAAPLLAGARGAAPCDLEAIVAAIEGLSAMALELGDLLDALDVNPLRCTPSGCVALDVLVETATQSA